MAGVFKNMRRKLASENKTAAYLRYAVGEILLVVIGILIALQVNTWREQYVEHQKELSTLTLLLNDLKEDQDGMKVFVEKLTQQNDNLVSFFKKIDTHVPVDTLVVLVRRGTRGWNYRHSAPTYTGLKQSGSMDIIRDEQIRNKILSYHDYLMTYLTNLVDNYQQSYKETRVSLRSYLDIRPDDQGNWNYLPNNAFLKIKSDPKTLNTIADYGTNINWLKIRLNTVFIPENEKLQKEIQTYMDKIK